VAGRLTSTVWPPALHITAVDAETGVLHVFAHDSGPSLVEAVSASGAVPGISPPVPFGGRLWIDGGMVSSANALVAHGYDRVVALAPLPESYGGIPSVADDVATLSRSAQVTLLVPDEAARAAIGANIYDPERRPAARPPAAVRERPGCLGRRWSDHPGAQTRLLVTS
jgi:NTE family protein